MPTRPLADSLLAELTRAYEGARDPGAAAAMAAYMRHQFPFLGIPLSRRRAIDREVLRRLPAPAEPDLVAVGLACWARPEREYQQFGAGYLRRHVGVASPALLDTVERLITTKSWWDTVDEVAKHVVGPLVAGSPALLARMDAWAVGGQPWLARSAILHQLTYRERTDTGRLFAYCAANAASTDFFLRKAIGWALREHARTDPEAVAAFVDHHHDDLSGLSRREALKGVARWAGGAARP
jgi:3-methyladenine DNA glycosylase AlkD